MLRTLSKPLLALFLIDRAYTKGPATKGDYFHTLKWAEVTNGDINETSSYHVLFNILKKNNIKVSLFIDPKIKNVEQALKLNADNIELHTGTYCNLLNNKNKKKINLEFEKIKKTAVYAKKNNLGVHCGHGLNYLSAKKLKKIKEILEFNIGHFIISDSIFFGLTKVIKNFTKIIKN